MSRMKDYMIGLANLEVSFVELCEVMLAKEGYLIIQSEPHPGPGFERHRPELIAIDPVTNDKILVEAKIWRSPKVERTLLRNAISSLSASVTTASARKGVLIVPVPLDPMPSSISARSTPIEA